MELLLERLKELKLGDYIFLALDFIVLLLVIILLIKKIKKNKKEKKEAHLEELLIDENIEEVKEESVVNKVVEEEVTIQEVKEEVVDTNEKVEPIEILEEPKEEVLSNEPINEELTEVKTLIEEVKEEDVEVLPVEEKEETKVKEKVKKVRVTRKEPVKIERVEKIKKDDYTKDSEFTKIRILLANKVEYKLGKGWENTFKRARRNEVFKDKVWPFIYDSYQENKDITPSFKNLFKPFEYCDPEHTKVVFINKQPSLHVKEDGLAFSTKEKSHKTNLFNELYEEARVDRKVRAIRYDDGNLEGWAKQGVFLYNYILLNALGETKKHENAGYEVFSNMVIKDLVKDENPKVFVVFGSLAYSNLMSILKNNTNHKVIYISSPSKIKGSNMFSEINTFLESKGIEPINWSLGKIRK